MALSETAITMIWVFGSTVVLVLLCALASCLNISKLNNTPAMRDPMRYGTPVSVQEFPGTIAIPAVNTYPGGQHAMPVQTRITVNPTANAYFGGHQAISVITVRPAASPHSGSAFTHTTDNAGLDPYFYTDNLDYDEDPPPYTEAINHRINNQ